MQTLVLVVLLAAVFGLLVPAAQGALRGWLKRTPAGVWIFPPLLTGAFAGAAALVDVWSPRLILLVLAYSLAPVACSVLAARRALSIRSHIPNILDFAAILLIWLPLEFAAGGTLVPRAAQGFLHSVAYGIAILLGLILFLGYRGFEGLKYNLPRNRRDFWLPLAGFALLAPILAVLGVAIGFIPPPHLPVQSAGKMAGAVGIIFAGTAIPEEILFRSLIQNLLMQRFGRSWRILLLSSLIFGSAHLDNGPQPAPNWRYMILATVAGFAYGKVFEAGSSVVCSAALHTMVDWTKHFFF